MAFVVEDGTGLTTSNAYISVAEFTTYWTDRGNTTATALSDADKQFLIIEATDYVDMRYGTRFLGVKLEDDQALAFPREYTGQTIYDGMPALLKKAVAEYAWIANSEDLAPNPAFDSTGRMATKEVKKVGPIDRETTYASRGAQATPALYRPYPKPDGLIKPLLVPGGTVYR